jgi:hypothetical protein
MSVIKKFRVGQRVRIRQGTDSDFAGHLGVIVYVGVSVCDVKIAHKQHGSYMTSTCIATFPYDALEILQRE